jgi:porin
LVCTFLGSTVSFSEEPAKLKTGYDNDESLAGPGSTLGQLEEDDIDKDPVLRLPGFDKALSPWFDWKKELYEKYGLQIGLAYTVLHQEADDDLGGEDHATSGVLRISGKWELFNRGESNMGMLVFSADNRSAYSDVAPGGLAGEFGYIGQTGALFSDADTILGDLYYVQYLNNRNTILVMGRYDPNDFFDVLGYANPWTAFQNLAILFNTSIGLADWSTGFGLGHWFNDQWYASASVNDANGIASRAEFDFHFDELYKTAEVGWSPSRAERYIKNAHITVWDVDDRDDDGVDGAQGITFGANWTWDERFMLFGKIGFSESDAANDPQINEESYTAGGMYRIRKRADLIGLGVNYGEPAAPGLDPQTSTELFYRVQLAENLAITPSLQWINDPALNPDEDNVFVFGLRMRFTL